MQIRDLQSLIRSIPDFPIPGILFRDVTPLLNDKGGFKTAVEIMAQPYIDERIDYVVA